MEILIIIILISINFFFALSEAAFISSKKANILEAHRKGRKKAKIILDFMKKPEKFLSSVQVGITLVGIISGAFGGLAIADDLNEILRAIPIIASISKELSVVIIVGLITYFSIVIGELLPKTIAIKNPEKILLSIIQVMNVFTKIFYPIVLFLSFSTKLLLRIFRTTDLNEKTENPIKEIISLTRFAVINKKINKDQEKILYNTININKIKLHEIMIENNDIKYLKSNMTLMDAMLEAHIHHHTRYPLLDQETNRVIGYINLKDVYSVLQINPKYESLKSISRDILYFKDNDKVVDVLPLLMKQFQHIAMVKNTEDEIIGLITFEDVIESIIGDINDEYDLLPEHIYKITENRYIIGGGIKLRKLKNELELSLPATDDVLSEWLIKISDNIITPEKRIKYKSYEFIVRKIKRGKINELILQI